MIINGINGNQNLLSLQLVLLPGRAKDLSATLYIVVKRIRISRFLIVLFLNNPT